MASFAFTDAHVTVNGVDLSDHVRKVTIKTEVDDLENTAMGAVWKGRLGGLKDWSLDLEFNQDFAASNVDATLWPLLGNVTTVTVRPTSAAKSATNPEYAGPALVAEYTPMDGSVGDLATTSVSWPGAGLLTRAVS